MLFFAKLLAVLSLLMVPLKAEMKFAEPDTLAITVKTTFPDSELFGIKVVNGRTAEAVVSIKNDEAEAVRIQLITGTLYTLDAPGKPSRILRNLSATTYKTTIPPSASDSLSYKFTTDITPQDLRLDLMALLLKGNSEIVKVPVFNETISIIEAPQSIFDPQIIFLYLVVFAAFSGTAYFIYNTWVASLFPQQKKRGTGGNAKTGPKIAKKAGVTETATETPSAETAATSVTGAKGYDESWIPAHHMQRPQTKRSRSGTPGGNKTKS